jgi:solute carrier family 25 protein 34/35
VISTRLYNQGVTSTGSGARYTSIFDCARQLVRSEGVSALYKGFWPHYLRLGPQVMLTFVFWEQLKVLTAPNL